MPRGWLQPYRIAARGPSNLRCYRMQYQMLIVLSFLYRSKQYGSVQNRWLIARTASIQQQCCPIHMEAASKNGNDNTADRSRPLQPSRPRKFPVSLHRHCNGSMLIDEARASTHGPSRCNKEHRPCRMGIFLLLTKEQYTNSNNHTMSCARSNNSDWLDRDVKYIPLIRHPCH